MKYDAITIDTNIFYNNGYALNKGLLKQLTQFKEGSIKFILSDVVHKEVHNHILRNNTDEYAKLTSALKNNKEKNLISQEAWKEIIEILEKENDITAKTKKYLGDFIEHTGCEVIQSSILCSMDKLLHLYFNTKPPFGNKKDKKSEFPDAIALLSIEKWAEENNKNILVVSKDKGWKQFIENSQNLSIEDDLGKALSELQEAKDKAQTIVNKFINDIINETNSAMLRSLRDSIHDEVADLNLYPDACSGFYHDVNDLNIDFIDFRLLEAQDSSIVRIGKELIVAEVPIEIDLIGSADFSFSVYDSIDRDYVHIGDANIEKQISLRASMLLSLNVYENDTDRHDIEIYNVEIINYPHEVNFGEVEPDFSSEDPTYEKY